MDYITSKQYAKLHNISVSWVKQWAQQKRIPAEKIGRDWLIPKDAPRPKDERLVECPIRNRRKNRTL
jgi:excisionase family DNA binding protein